MNVYEFKPKQPDRPAQEPALNLPPVIVWLSAVMIAIHVLRTLVLPQDWANAVLMYFAFWPVRYDPILLFNGTAPGGVFADIWAFLTYGLLHGSTMHIVFNLLWMAIFGTAVARRFGVARFLMLSGLCTVGGAIAHLATHVGEATPMIGASAAVSGQMAAALRFIFEIGGPMGTFRRSDNAAYRVPAVPLMQSLRNPQVIGFTAVWFGLNLFFGLLSGSASESIAWQAHIGGFLTGLVLFPMLDPVSRRGF